MNTFSLIPIAFIGGAKSEKRPALKGFESKLRHDFVNRLPAIREPVFSSPITSTAQWTFIVFTILIFIFVN